MVDNGQFGRVVPANGPREAAGPPFVTGLNSR
jgi:hypothetical protein